LVETNFAFANFSANTNMKKNRSALQFVLIIGIVNVRHGLRHRVVRGSAAMGLLYDKSLIAVALFSMILQLSAIPVIFLANKER